MMQVPNARYLLHLFTALLVWTTLFGLIAPSQAQQRPPALVVIVYPVPQAATTETNNVAFERGLIERGLTPGRNLIIERIHSEPTAESVSRSIKQAVARKPAVLVVWGALGARVAKDENVGVPVVFLSASFPVETGVVSNIRRPGGNITGIATEAAVEVYGKRLELLKEVQPSLTRVALLYAIADPNSKHAIDAINNAAATLNISVLPVGVREAGELEASFAAIKQGNASGVVVVGTAFAFTHRQRIADLALRYGLPSIHHVRESVEAGGLMNFGANLAEIAHQGATYVAKILSGTNPGDLPVEQPRKYELVINQKTAKALGIKFPESILLRADEVIK